MSQQNQKAGKFLGRGTYKCVFSPAIRCKGEEKSPFYPNSNDYVSAIMTNKDAKEELTELSKITKIDPTGDFTLNVQKQCQIGELSQEEAEKEFEECLKGPLKGYTYPFDKYDGYSDKDLTQLVFKKGGITLNDFFYHCLEEYNTEEKFITALCAFLQVIYSLYKFQKNKIAHCDIKGINILYNEKENRFYLIDFGLSKDHKELFHEGMYYHYTFNENPQENYEYWPKDIGISHLIYKYQTSQTDTEKDKFKKLLQDSFNDIYRTTMTQENFQQSYLQKFINNSREKVDIYSLGIILKKLFEPNSHIVAEILEISVDLFKTEFDKLLNRMLDLDPINRIDYVDIKNNKGEKIKNGLYKVYFQFLLNIGIPKSKIDEYKKAF